jgi:hypothetical protein
MSTLTTRTRRQVGGAILGVCIGGLVILVLALMVRTWSLTDQIRAGQIENTHARESSDRTLQAVRSCTTPGQSCYDRGQSQTAKAVGDINRVVILAAACSSSLPAGLSVSDRQSRIQQCVIDRLAASRPAGP